MKKWAKPHRRRAPRHYRASEQRRLRARAVLDAFIDRANGGLGEVYDIIDQRLQSAYQTIGAVMAVAMYTNPVKPTLLGLEGVTEEDFDLPLQFNPKFMTVNIAFEKVDIRNARR